MKRAFVFLVAGLLSIALVACSVGAVQPATVAGDTQSVAGVSEEAAATFSTAGAPVASVAQAVAENGQIHADLEDLAWDSATAIPIVLNGDTITAGGDGVAIAGSQATITAAGAYQISGSLTDGQIRVDTDDQAAVTLILAGVDLRSSSSSALYIVNAETTVIVLADNTDNYLADGKTYALDNPDDDEPNAALFSKGDLILSGNGSLTVSGNYNDGIASKDGLVIAGGTLTVNAVDDGLRGKDYLAVQAGHLTVTAQGDGLKSDNEEDASLGYILIESGVINVTAGGDALDAQTDVLITGGEFTLTTGGGSRNSGAATASAKGIKATAAVAIAGGAFTINSADAALPSNGAGEGILVPADSPVRSVAELKGKKVGVTKGSSAHNLLVAAFASPSPTRAWRAR